MADPLDKKFDVIESATDDFLKELGVIDQRLALEIVKIYSKFVIGDELILKADELAKLEQSIIAAISATGYKSAVDSFVPNFDVIQALNKDIHKLQNKINVQDVLLEADKIKNHQSVVESQLRGTPSAMVQVTDVVDGKKVVNKVPIRNASLDELVKPISDMIREDVLLGVTFEAATQSMLESITTKKLGLEQWAGQIGRDALSQHDGVIQQSIKEEFSMQYSRYIGTIKDTTRPICYHLLTKKDEPVYTDEELAAVLSEFCPGGVPSTVPTTNTPDGRDQRKGGGMIPGTDVMNFHIRRGGYNCRHQYIPSLVP